MDEWFEQIEKICEDIKKRDKTFDYRIGRSLFPNWDWILIILSDSKDKAHKRGLLFVKKYLSQYNLFYWVKEVATLEGKT
jgi:hypothetical protein